MTLLTALGLFLGGIPGEAHAQTVQLTVGQTTISFPDANPDLVPSITSTPTPVAVTVRVTGNGGRPWSLTIAAADHLRSGASVIAINNVTWTSSTTANGFLAGGALAVSPAQTVASGTGNMNTRTSNLTFQLANLWTFDPGNYSTSATFTLSAP
jgi:hypothetical protein